MTNQLSKEEIKAKVFEMTSEKFGVNYEEISTGSSFTGNLGADSLDLVEMVMTIEKEFGILVPDSDARHFKTVGNVIDFIDSRINVQ